VAFGHSQEARPDQPNREGGHCGRPRASNHSQSRHVVYDGGCVHLTGKEYAMLELPLSRSKNNSAC
jgi:hypothetical protein